MVDVLFSLIGKKRNGGPSLARAKLDIKADINPVSHVMHTVESGSGHKLLDLCLRFGAAMNTVGSESSRAEDSIVRILKAYGVIYPSAFVIPTVVIVSFKDEEGNIYASTKRVLSQTSDFIKLDQLNTLSRKLCGAEKQTLSFFESELDRIDQAPTITNWSSDLNNLLGIILSAFGFNFVFGGDFLNSIGVLIASFLMAIVNTTLAKLEINSSFNNFASSLSGNIFVRLLSSTILINNPSTASISILMGLVPGMLLTNGIREILSKDFTSGLNKLVEGIFVAISLAIGAAIAIWIV